VATELGRNFTRMNEDILKSIHEELVAIRQLLASQQSTAARSAPARATTAPRAIRAAVVAAEQDDPTAAAK